MHCRDQIETGCCTFVGGFVLTGMLFLAGAPESLLWSALPISTFLALTGGICVFADRLFGEERGAFSRDQFGLAFYRAGRITLLASLAVLFGSQVADVAIELLPWLPAATTPMVLISQAGQVWSLAILAGTACVFLYSCFTTRGGVFDKTMFGIVSIWSVVVAMQLFNIEITFDLGLLLVAIMVVIANALIGFRNIKQAGTTQRGAARNEITLLAAIASVLMFFGLGRYFVEVAAQESTPVNDWMQICQLLATSAALLTIPGIWSSHCDRWMRGFVMGLGSVGMTMTLAIILFGLSPVSGPLGLQRDTVPGSIDNSGRGGVVDRTCQQQSAVDPLPGTTSKHVGDDDDWRCGILQHRVAAEHLPGSTDWPAGENPLWQRCLSRVEVALAKSNRSSNWRPARCGPGSPAGFFDFFRCCDTIQWMDSRKMPFRVGHFQPQPFDSWKTPV